MGVRWWKERNELTPSTLPRYVVSCGTSKPGRGVASTVSVPLKSCSSRFNGQEGLGTWHAWSERDCWQGLLASEPLTDARLRRMCDNLVVPNSLYTNGCRRHNTCGNSLSNKPHSSVPCHSMSKVLPSQTRTASHPNVSLSGMVAPTVTLNLNEHLLVYYVIMCVRAILQTQYCTPYIQQISCSFQPRGLHLQVQARVWNIPSHLRSPCYRNRRCHLGLRQGLQEQQNVTDSRVIGETVLCPATCNSLGITRNISWNHCSQSVWFQSHRVLWTRKGVSTSALHSALEASCTGCPQKKRIHGSKCTRCMCILSASKGLEGKGREHFYIRHPPQGKRHVSNSWQGRHRSGRKGWVLCKLRSLVIRNSPGPTGVNNPINPQKTVVFEGPLPKCMAGKGSLLLSITSHSLLELKPAPKRLAE